MSPLPVLIFVFFLVVVLGLSFYFARRSRSVSGYYAAGGSIPWSVNGVAFAGDYLSAASFLGICGMIATAGYDGFLYSIGFLAGWVVALFIVAEPMKRLGKYTFAEPIDARFNSRGIKLAAAISTLVVSICYLIPQMAGAGVLVTPLLGIPHHIGVIIVGFIVITIVATAGMTSTTYVQFIKGGLLLVVAVLSRGVSTNPDQGGKVPFHRFKTLAASNKSGALSVSDPAFAVAGVREIMGVTLVKLSNGVSAATWWKAEKDSKTGLFELREAQSVTVLANGIRLINGKPASRENQLIPVGNMEAIEGKPGSSLARGALHRRYRQGDGVLPARRRGHKGPQARPPLQGVGEADRADRLRLPHARPLPRHRFAPPHPHPLLHRA